MTSGSESLSGHLRVAFVFVDPLVGQLRGRTLQLQASPYDIRFQVLLILTFLAHRPDASKTSNVGNADARYERFKQALGLFPDAPRPYYTGQSAWRLVTWRRRGIDQRHFFLGGPAKVGLNPVSSSQMYMFVLENTPRKRVPDTELHVELRKLLLPYGGIVAQIRDELTEGSNIVFRPLEGFLLPLPWSHGCCLLIGDAAHPTTPQLASGAGLAVEDALVLGQVLEAAASVPHAFAKFMQRRYERCRLVVENSIEIGRREQSIAPVEVQTALVSDSLRVLAEPI